MSANLLDDATVMRGTKDGDGYWVLSQNDGTDKQDSPMWRVDGQPTLTENQTIHMACSVMPDEDWGSNAARMSVKYTDSAGHSNWAGSNLGTARAGAWTRLEAEIVVPSGMRMTQCLLTNAYKRSSGAKVTGVTISYGSPVTLASSAHTPYATQDHVAAEYATKAALKVTSDAVTAEVTERGKLAGRVGTLESTSSTHTSKLEQLATSIKSLVKGESTYTDPDGKSATSGIYSLVTQTRDSVTALFGQYTKTADLASTQAVKDAKKAGTDAASAASAAQSTADTAKANAATAQSTADRAQSTADAALDNAGTANGRVRAVEARVSASIDGLDVRVRGVSEAVSAQGATVRDVERNMSFGLDGLVIGAADSASKVRITEKRETFEVDGKTVLALDGDTSTVEASALKIGGYVWTATNGGKNLTLVYRG